MANIRSVNKRHKRAIVAQHARNKLVQQAAPEKPVPIESAG